MFVEPPVLPVGAYKNATIPAWCGLDKVSDKEDAGEDEDAFNRSVRIPDLMGKEFLYNTFWH